MFHHQRTDFLDSHKWKYRKLLAIERCEFPLAIQFPSGIICCHYDCGVCVIHSVDSLVYVQMDGASTRYRVYNKWSKSCYDSYSGYSVYRIAREFPLDLDIPTISLISFSSNVLFPSNRRKPTHQICYHLCVCMAIHSASTYQCQCCGRFNFPCYNGCWYLELQCLRELYLSLYSVQHYKIPRDRCF